MIYDDCFASEVVVRSVLVAPAEVELGAGMLGSPVEAGRLVSLLGGEVVSVELVIVDPLVVSVEEVPVDVVVGSLVDLDVDVDVDEEVDVDVEVLLVEGAVGSVVVVGGAGVEVGPPLISKTTAGTEWTVPAASMSFTATRYEPGASPVNVVLCTRVHPEPAVTIVP